MSWPAGYRNILGAQEDTASQADIQRLAQQLLAEMEGIDALTVGDTQIKVILEAQKKLPDRRKRMTRVLTRRSGEIARGEEMPVEVSPGQTAIVKFLTVGDAHRDGTRPVFFELNGEPRQVNVRDQSLKVETRSQPKVTPGEAGHVGAPTPGLITGVYVKAGTAVHRNEKLLDLEAMKIQSTIYAPFDGRVSEVLVEPGQQVEAKDLLLVIAAGE